MNVDEGFAREYRRLYQQAGERALLAYTSEAEVEYRVGDCVAELSRALDGVDINIAYLSLSHVLEHHFLKKMAGR